MGDTDILYQVEDESLSRLSRNLGYSCRLAIVLFIIHECDAENIFHLLVSRSFS